MQHNYSENFYKYLATIGFLLIVLSVYYPLKEKQELEILKIQLENDVKTLNHNIKENSKNVQNIKINISKNGTTDYHKELLMEVEKLNNENHISQIESEKKFSEINVRIKYIKLYKIMLWLLFPIGIFLIVYAFMRDVVEQSLKKYKERDLLD